ARSSSSSPLHPPALPVTSPLSLHDALPIFRIPLFKKLRATHNCTGSAHSTYEMCNSTISISPYFGCGGSIMGGNIIRISKLIHRSEEHTSELQSRENLVCRLLLEKKNSKCP